MTQRQQLLDDGPLVMAFDRKSFKNRLLGTLGGAITHYYMVRLAELNKQTKWVQHWNKEVDRLINMDFVVTVVSEIKGKWDKRKAIAECLADIKAADSRYRTVAAHYVAKVYKLKKVNKQLAEDVDRLFYEMVHEGVENTLPARDD